jgi:exonuclease SbcC
MIAQNDFLRFLQSGAEDRARILRRIFDTEQLRRFQELLKARAKSANEARGLVLRDFERNNADPRKQKEQFAEWERRIISDTAALADADELIRRNGKIRADLAGMIAVASELGGKFSDLAACRAALEEHNAKAGEFAVLSKRHAMAETASRRVKPAFDKASGAERAYSAASADLHDARAKTKAAEEESERAGKALAALPPLGGAQTELELLRRECERMAEKSAELDALRKNREEIAAKRKFLESARLDFEKLSAEYLLADERYRAAEELFLRNQAGILAAGLRDRAPCPVCGSTEHPFPAAMTGEGVSEAKVKHSRDAADKAKDKRGAKASECEKLKTEIETLTDRFLKDFSKFVPAPLWDFAEEQLKSAIAQARAALDDLTARKNAGEGALSELSKKWAELTKRRTDGEAALKAALALTSERENREAEQLKSRDEARAAFYEALYANGFSGESDFAAAIAAEDEIAVMAKLLSDYENSGKQLARDIERLETETSGKERPDLEKLTSESEKIEAVITELQSARDETKIRLENTSRILNELRASAVALARAERECAVIGGLSGAANGKLDFETYAQAAYFERVLRAANQRLKVMSQNRYVLRRKEEAGDKRLKTGLEIEVADSYTGKNRSANTLSGGESFMASLALALGLSDAVQQSAGGARLDAMFIDEGFGSLDSDVLELAVRTLSDMAGGNRVIGIISHVAELRERIDKQVRVEKTTSGSRISLSI